MATQGWLFGTASVGGPLSARGPADLPAAGTTQPAADRRGAARPIRVVLLSIAIVLMSLADLQITLTYLRSGGMGEGNPIARHVMEHGSVGLLVAWKCASVVFAAMIFVRFRNRRSTEIACWGCVVILAWLLIRWSTYADEAFHLTPALHLLPESEAAMWVELPG